MKKIGIFAGSLRKASFNKSIARYVKKQSSDTFNYEIIEIGDLPLYNQDYDDEGPAPVAYEKFRAAVKATDGVLFITPEYNRSVPAVLKNALDVGSRPYGQNVWAGKPGGIISSSPGNISGFGANHHLRQSLVFLDVLTLQQPEAYLAHIADSINKDGELHDPKVEAFLSDFLKAYEAWVLKLSE
ncbi:NADPH-dependent FMN reductase [Parabacteroides sp. Marseille-P3160]|uniref:NADPH-dependent FMN reductase n=1 Tax=Parabacteroides sp. Marseille-P3160 TaxID=1917887 RepID=UPI0009BADD2C|nr:NAD(P)H-dependent oxidoreductase [Parabacteroides sp. Marseille-P3160]